MKRAGSRSGRAGAKGDDRPKVLGMLGQAVQNHVASFNNFLDDGLEEIVQQVRATEIEPQEPHDVPIVVNLVELNLQSPMNRTDSAVSAQQLQRKWLPKDCRLAHTTYAGKLTGKFVLRVGDEPRTTEAEVDLGNIPIMVRSKRCNLHGMTPRQLVDAGEDETENGGYFLLSGLERVIRMLVMPRANFPMAVVRPSYKSRGHLYTENAVIMRCMRQDGSTLTNSLHYCTDGSVFLRFSHSREEWLIPLVLAAKCCFPCSDRLLIELMTGGGAGKVGSGGPVAPGPNHQLWESMLVMMQQQNAKQVLATMGDAREFLGRTFRIVMGRELPRRYTDEEAGAYIVKRFFMVHAEEGWEKLQTLCVMFQKLMALVRGDIDGDNQDAMSSHDVLPPGQLYGMVLKEALEVSMIRINMMIRKWTYRHEERKRAKHRPEDFLTRPELLKTVVTHSADVQKQLASFLATGNLRSRSGMDLMQSSGYTIVADKLNQARFSSHFASVHRGQYFAEMKTTTVRKLLPETWGFLCPVHTPDGSPCGLLNHLAESARLVTKKAAPGAANAIMAVLAGIGARLWEPSGETFAGPPPGGKFLWIMLDGRPLGYLEASRLSHADRAMRDAKLAGEVPKDMEVVCISRSFSRLFCGLFLFTGPGRLVRPVRCLRSGQQELIGPLEQLFLNVSALVSEREQAHAILDKRSSKDGKLENYVPEQLPIRYSHEELCPTQMFSLLASLTPFSNHNQSPRNMYQCQMLKQTMGTPYHNHVYRADNKVFRILNPQKPMVRTQTYTTAGCDLHPTGTNAVVAVITYTGYDMEDAMIINKSSYERGFGHGVVYKTKVISAASKSLAREDAKLCHFANPRRHPGLDSHGLPQIGRFVEKDDPLYSYIDHLGKDHLEKYHDDEPCYVEHVSLVEGSEIQGGGSGKRLMMRLRYPRNPVVGDKFSSRHGQKGVMSMLWPQEDMPFTENGVTPDILFNPHGFPSRMTIGMLIESIGGKACAAEGRTTADATTFREYQGHYGFGDDNEGDPFPRHEEGKAASAAKVKADERRRERARQLGGVVREEPKAADYFGRLLAKHGFQRLGTDRMYSGIHGTELETDIFCGVVYYQRLRHLVADKAQVRARGANDHLLGQPVKGRKKHGGIRFGEMERDSLLAHGCSYLLHDRLMRCSDYDVAFVCPQCHSIITPQANAGSQIGVATGEGEFQSREGETWVCPPCTRKTKRIVRCHQMPVPVVLRYMVCELAAMNIKMQVRLKDCGRQASLLKVGVAAASAVDGRPALQG